MPTTCGGHKQTTVRAHLDSFGIPLVDVFYEKWRETVLLLSQFCAFALSQSAQADDMSALWNIIFHFLYVDYNMEKDFLPQFEANIAKLQGLVATIGGETFPIAPAKE